MTILPSSSDQRGTGAHVVTVREWEGGIFTWTCTCRIYGNAPYGQEQLEQQLEEHLEAHGQGKRARMAELEKVIRESTRPLTKKERRELHERRMDERKR